jgi:glucose/arabinose dehydrogenase
MHARLLTHALLAATLTAGCTASNATSAQSAPVEQGPRNAPHLTPAFSGQTRAPEKVTYPTLSVQTVATGLERPWGLGVLPDGRMLVTERPGRLWLFTADGTSRSEIAGVPTVAASGQGGLLDVAASPTFASDRHIFFTYAKPGSTPGTASTAVARGVLRDGRLEDVTDLLVQTPATGASVHYGSRLAFAPNGDLFVTFGDRGDPPRAQDDSDLAGTVARIDPNAGAAADPASAIWSTGHRNVQSAAVHPETGRLWTVEHGPRGGDELNRPEAGGDHGWPRVSYGVNYNGTPVGSGRASAEGVTEPRYFWDPVIAPSGMAFYTGGVFEDWEGNILVGSLNPGGLVRLELQGDRVIAEERFRVGVERVRDVHVTASGDVLILVDADDGAIRRLTPPQ